MNALVYSMLSLGILATTSHSAAHASIPAFAESSDDSRHEVERNAYGAHVLTLPPTIWYSIAGNTIANLATQQLAASGNGGLQLCPSGGPAAGYSHGYSGESNTLGCDNTGRSFSLNNSGDDNGTNGVGTSTARVSGYANGRLELKGDGGIAIMGEATFEAAANMSGHQINALASATEDTDAVNLSQLKSAASALGGDAQFNPDGSFTGPTYDLLNGGAQITVGGALTALDNAITYNTAQIGLLDNRASVNEGDITDIYERLNGFGDSVGLLRRDPSTGIILLGDSLNGRMIDLTGMEGPRVLTGVANGTNDTDAVNMAQLKAMGTYDPVNNRILGALVYDDETLGRSTLGGTNGTVVANLAGGLVAKGSREAINGGQLFDMQSELQNQLDDLDDRVGEIEDGTTRGGGGGGGGGGDGGGGDAGGERIRNIGDGEDITDAASLGQVNEALKSAKVYADTKFNEVNDALESFKGEVRQRFQRIDNRIDRMGAMSAAQTQMAINASGATTARGRLAVGVGLQNSKSALAIGYATRINERMSLSIGGAFSGSENNAGAGIGVDL